MRVEEELNTIRRCGQPGLTGGSDDTYVQHLTRRASKQGWQVVVFNSRGCADSPVTTPQVLLYAVLMSFIRFSKIVMPKCLLWNWFWLLSALFTSNRCFEEQLFFLIHRWDEASTVIDMLGVRLQFYSASFTEDLRQVVKHTAFLFPSKRVYAAGWSLGANILVRYLGQVSLFLPCFLNMSLLKFFC